MAVSNGLVVAWRDKLLLVAATAQDINHFFAMTTSHLKQLYVVVIISNWPSDNSMM